MGLIAVDSRARDSPAMRLGLLIAVIATTTIAQPFRAPFSGETLNIPGNQAGDTAILKSDFYGGGLVFGSDAVNNGLYGFFLDGGTAVFLGPGAVGGVDALSFGPALPSFSEPGLVAVSANTAGNILLLSLESDGGLRRAGPALPVLGPRALALADFGDAGAHLFYATSANQLFHATLSEDGGTVLISTAPAVGLPFPPQALAVHPGWRKVYASIGSAGVFEIDPEAATSLQLVDAGTPADIAGGLALYSQRDGGALLLATLPAQDLIRVFRLQPGLAEPIADFTITAPDGGRTVRGAEFIEVSPPLGPLDGGPFPYGLISMCDRNSSGGANYKFIRWEDFAGAAMPPLPIDVPGDDTTPIPPKKTRASQVIPITSASVDLAWSRKWDSLLMSADGVSLRPAANGAQRPLSLDAGVTVVGVASLDSRGLIAAAANSPDAGTVVVWGSGADGGFQNAFVIQTDPLLSLALSESPDGGLHIFVGTTRGLFKRWKLSSLADGGVTTSALSDIALPKPGLAIAPLFKDRTVISSGSGLWSLNSFEATPLPARLVDAGAALFADLTVYPQSDGGALVLAARPSTQSFAVYEAQSPLFRLVAEFQLASPDGGELLEGAQWLAVSADEMGRIDGGVSRWPEGVLAVGTRSADAGAVYLFDWGALARNTAPPLPIDALRRTGSGGGSAGGMASGGGGSVSQAGGRTGGGTGGGDTVTEPPKGCCSGAPQNATFPVIVFVLWLWGFRRRTMSRDSFRTGEYR